jgi:hypothetical protein
VTSEKDLSTARERPTKDDRRRLTVEDDEGDDWLKYAAFPLAGISSGMIGFGRMFHKIKDG